MESVHSRSTQDKKYNYRMSDNLKFIWYSRNSKGSGIGQSMVMYHSLHFFVKQIIYISISTIQDKVLKCQYSFPRSPFTSFPLLVSLGGWIWFQSRHWESVPPAKQKSHISSFVHLHSFLCCSLFSLWSPDSYSRQFAWDRDLPTSRLFNSWLYTLSFSSFHRQCRVSFLLSIFYCSARTLIIYLNQYVPL